jgi:hypothetical protein
MFFYLLETRLRVRRPPQAPWRSPRINACARARSRCAIKLHDVRAAVWVFLFACAAPQVEDANARFRIPRFRFDAHYDCGHGNSLLARRAENSTV